ncbi:hypothetical protein ACIF6H_35340 [Streptomyces microflavus]|uniref:Uncharacterized protein n=1 Tax=Streptomyces microflavus TaxID=1919 RepID=A0A7H8N0T8_STRMI|nr:MULTISPECIES: hypothetical protein [Streptomyces]MBW3363012.1 hypothetical protein [Streptomyces sp. 09ZI22]QKW48019.1 hypothetical protein HUT09_36655 [Streptomyces microflavus]
MAKVIERAGVGELYGHDFGGGEVVLFASGPDADALFASGPDADALFATMSPVLRDPRDVARSG